MSVAARLENQVADALRRAGYSGQGVTLVVAVSGGPDSSALLYSLRRLSQPHRLKLHLAHLNHDFRGEEAEADARFVTALAHELGLPATVAKRDPTEYQRQRGISSFEQAAREMRYTFLAEVAGAVGAAAVAVGHTADDLAETVLLHLLRGAGLHGLRGMAELSPWPVEIPPPEKGDLGAPGLRLFRPLLEATRAETTAYCQELGRSYQEDSGNYLPRFTRNRVRHQLLPLLAAEYNPRIRESLVRLARTSALQLDYLEAEVDRLWPTVAAERDGAIRFRRAALASLHPALQRLLLRSGYAALKGDTRRLRESHLRAMAEMVETGAAGRTLTLPGGLWLHASYDYLLLGIGATPECPLPVLEGEHPLALPGAPGQETVTRVVGWRVTLRLGPPPAPSVGEAGGAALDSGGPLPSDGWTAALDRAALGDRVYVRARRPGDRFQPLGMFQEKKLQDFFTDARVPRAWRDRVPLLVTDQGIAWVVGYRIAHWASARGEELDPSSVLWVRFEQAAPESSQLT